MRPAHLFFLSFLYLFSFLSVPENNDCSQQLDINVRLQIIHGQIGGANEISLNSNARLFHNFVNGRSYLGACRV